MENIFNLYWGYFNYLFDDMDFFFSFSPLVLFILRSKYLFEHGQLKLILLMLPSGMAECLTSLSLKKFY